MKIFSSILVAMFLSGCSWLNVFDGNIPQNNWRIQKIIVGGKEYLSPQALKLKEEAQKDSADNVNNSSTEEDTQDQNTQAQESADSIDAASSEQNTLLHDVDTPSNDGDVKQSNDSSDDEFTSLNEVSTMTFDPSQHRIYGIAACNNYFASYAWKDDDHIEIGNSGITRKLCSPDELMSFEFRFMRDFNGLFTITKNKTSMILDNGKMQIYLQAITSE